MVAFFLILSLLAAQPQARPQLVMIENCDGSGQKFSSGAPQPDGEEWFSMRGRVSDSGGEPLCGAQVTAEYIVPVETKWGNIHGPSSWSGLSGEYFLDHIKKGVPFRLRVNPYDKLEWYARTEGSASVESFAKAQHNVRTGGLARYESEELKSTVPSGLMMLDVKLDEDPTATGIVVGKIGIVGPYDVEEPAVARILVAGREPIEAPVDRRTGEFIVFGVPTGRHRVDAEVSTKRIRHTMTQTVSVPSGKDSVARVELLAK